MKDQVRDAWKSSLGVDIINDSDEFFDLGGDSAAVLAMALQIEDDLGIFFDPALLYQHPQFSDFLVALQGAADSAELEEL